MNNTPISQIDSTLKLRTIQPSHGKEGRNDCVLAERVCMRIYRSLKAFLTIRVRGWSAIICSY